MPAPVDPSFELAVERPSPTPTTSGTNQSREHDLFANYSELDSSSWVRSAARSSIATPNGQVSASWPLSSTA